MITVTHPKLPRRRSDDQVSKKDAENEILLALRSCLTDFNERAVQHIQHGTPLTFRIYTGCVETPFGGIPHDKRMFPFRYPRLDTPLSGLLSVGKTFLSNQSIPGLTRGALAVGDRMGVVT